MEEYKKVKPQKLSIFKRDGTTVEVEPLKMWSPCYLEQDEKHCPHPSHKKEEEDKG